MNKNILIGTLSILVVIGGSFWLTQVQPADALTKDYMSTKYEIDGEMAELETNRVEYFGNEVWADFNADGQDDVSFLIARTSETGERSYYVAAALNLTEGFEGMNTVFLGKDIIPQTAEYKDGLVVVNFTTNMTGDMSGEQPTEGSIMGVTKFFSISTSGLISLN